MLDKAEFYRFPWDDFPCCIIHAKESAVRGHERYRAAKTGDSDAAFDLVRLFLNPACIRAIQELGDRTSGESVTFVSAHALEREGVNAIPEAMAEMLSQRLGWKVEHEIVQTNIVSHTKADGFSRLAKQAAFDGEVVPNQE